MRRLAAITLAAVLGAAAPAAADVRMSETEIVVRGEAAGAVIERSPFRVAFTDGAGRTVLRHAEAAGALGVAEPLPDPAPAAADAPRRSALYAPLTFTVGARREVQDPGGAWAGNILTGAEAGLHFASRDVVRAVEEGGGVRLTVSTTDPSGRTLDVLVAPDRTGAVRLTAAAVPAAGVASMGSAFATPDGEAFHGFGGRHDAVDHRGHDLYTWAEEENYAPGYFKPLTDAAIPGASRPTWQFPNGDHAAYYPQALFVSSEPYGFLLDQTELSRFRLASDRPDAWAVGVAAPRLEHVVAAGPAPAAIGTLTSITGRHRTPPAWALGPQTSQNIRGQDLVDGAGYAARVRADLRRIDELGLRFDAYDLFNWFVLDEATNRELIAALRARDIRPLLYFTPFLNVASDAAAIRAGYALRNDAGEPYLYASPFGVIGLVDFTNPDAVAWWQRKIRAGLELGGDGFMQDWGEQVHLDMVAFDGTRGAALHNRYPVDYHRATRAAVDAFEAAHPERGEVWFYTRSGYNGSAAHEGANFPGDNQTTFDRANGLASAASDMLNRAIGGAYGYSTDVGGYLDSTNPTTTKELFVRWSQWAALSPYLRLHNSVGSGTYQPWSFDGETLAIWRRVADLRERARPLLLDLFREAERTGMPPTRPMWLQFPGDAEAARQDQQWMLGPDVLVAPVVEEGATAREVYFPRGCWRHGGTGERFTGPESRRVDAPLGDLPWFERCGTDPIP
jgi:sulfoquinovosidase